MAFWDDINDNDVLRVIAPIVVLLLITSAALLLRRIIISRLHKWTEKTETEWDDIIIRSMWLPSLLWCFWLGIWGAFHAAEVPHSWEQPANEVTPILLIALGIYTGIAIIEVGIGWYRDEVAEKTASALDDIIMSALRWLVPAIAVFLGTILILYMTDIPDEHLHPNLSRVIDWLKHDGAMIGAYLGVGIALLLIVTAAVPKTIRRTVDRSKGEQTAAEVNKRVDTLSGVLVTSLQAVIIGTVLFMLLSDLGFDIGPMLAGVGVLGIAIGFGAQSLVKDIIAGIFILMENQYRRGDVVKIADASGLVEEINLRRTVLRDLDGVVHTVPNGEIRVASNLTKDWSRVNLNISVGYDTDLGHAIAVINRVGKDLAEDPNWAPAILTPPKALRVDNLGDSGIDIKIVGETKPIRQWEVMGELRLRLKKAFDEEGIEIPWPHTKVYFGNTPPPSVQKSNCASGTVDD